MLYNVTPNTSGRLTFERGDLAGRSYRYQAIVCQNPTCACQRVTLQCSPDTTEARSGNANSVCLEMDLEHRQIANLKQLKTDPAARIFAKAVAEELGKEQWDQLRRTYQDIKQYCTEHSDLNQLQDVCFPVEVLDEPSAMVGYYELFPYAKPLEFEHGQQRWLLDDQYCCDPNCPCEEAVLSLVRIPDQRGQTRVRPSLAIAYDYRSGKIGSIEAEEDVPIPAERLLASLKAAHPDLDSLLAKRQSLLRSLYERTAQKRAPRQPGPKMGRNAPCPCGSGKKYKKCCGR